MRYYVKILVVLLIAYACKKETQGPGENVNPNPESFTELKVPDNFDYKTTKTLNYNFDLSNPVMNGKYKIKVYDFVPTAGGGLVKSEFIDNNAGVSGELSIASDVNKLYLQLEAPDGSSSLHILPVSSGSLNYTFQSGKKAKSKAQQVISTNCNSGCDVSYTNHNSNVNINNNDPGSVFCIVGGFNNRNLNVNKANVTIRVCGNVDFRNVSLNNGSRMEITDGAVVDFDQLNLNGSSGEVVIYDAEVFVKGNFSPNGAVVNHGELEVEDNYNINGNGSLVNNGLLKVGIDLNQNNDLTNNGTMEIGDDLNLNGSSSTINNCSVVIDDDLNANSNLTNNAYMFAGDQFLINGGSNVTMVDGAMIEANRSTINGTITGTGSTSLVKLFDSSVFGNSLETIINGGGTLTGNLQYCDNNGIETNTGNVTNGASFDCSVYIPTSSCFLNGNGVPTIVDSDGDGVADENDEYPNDALRAANSYYPGANQTATLAFEDLWPGKGDYDFNDIVLDYRFRSVTNADNEVVDLEILFALRAIGGSLRNGMGIQLEVPASDVASTVRTNTLGNLVSINGNGMESGQSKAVIILFDDAFNELTNNGTQTVNTNPQETPSAIDTTIITLTFNSPKNPSELGVAPYNPFIFINQDRGKEVHLTDMEPTDLVNTNFFGTVDDDSNPGQGRYYVTSGNLPWGLNIAQRWDYPVEKQDIVQAYLKFAEWAQSAGNNFEDWYSQEQPGYRDALKIF